MCKTLTSKMSATIDQLRLIDSSPRKMRKQHMQMLELAQRAAAKSRGALTSRPQAHMQGSARGYLTRILCARNDPAGTPMIPDTMVITPNLYDTLEPNNNVLHQVHLLQILIVIPKNINLRIYQYIVLSGKFIFVVSRGLNFSQRYTRLKNILQ